MPATPQTHRDLQREETRQRLYLAALHVFRRDGFGPARVDDIAKLAEVSRAAFYFHFPTKEDVVLRVLDDAEARCLKAVAHLESPEPLRTLLERVAETWAAYWRYEEDLILDALTLDQRLRSSSALRAHLTGRFETAVRLGEVRSTFAPPTLTELALGMLRTVLVEWARGSRTLPLEAQALTAMRAFLRGVAPVKH